MSRTNVWSNPSQAGASEVSQMAAFLEERSRSPDMQAVNASVRDVLAPSSGEHILEVGCGSGILCRMIAPHIQPIGRIDGMDISLQFLIEAKKILIQEGKPDGMTFACGAGESLPYPDATFDSAFAARLLLHVDKPDRVVNEMVRVVKQGGRVVVMDWDFETVAVDHPDHELTRKLLHWRNDHRGGNNWSGRQLWRRMVASGLQSLAVHPVVTVAKGEADALTQSLWRAAEAARDDGAISPDEHDAWVNEMKERIQSNTYFASIVYFIISGRVP